MVITLQIARLPSSSFALFFHLCCAVVFPTLLGYRFSVLFVLARKLYSHRALACFRSGTGFLVFLHGCRPQAGSVFFYQPTQAWNHWGKKLVQPLFSKRTSFIAWIILKLKSYDFRIFKSLHFMNKIDKKTHLSFSSFRVTSAPIMPSSDRNFRAYFIAFSTNLVSNQS